MCRLFGFRSNFPRAVHRSLVEEKNSLRAQSNEHKDGWGIAYYPGIEPTVAHGVGPAHQDPEFERLSGLISAPSVLAHVRLASVGAVHLRNAHPFLHGRWSFAHNGTVREFCKVESQITALLDPSLRRLIRGETDSERCFYVFLTELEAIAPGEQNPVAKQVAQALVRTMSKVAAIADEPGQPPSSLTFLATNGAVMVATRRQRSLFYSELQSTPHAHAEPAADVAVSQLVIASEKLSSENHWHEIPEDSVLGVEADLTLRRWSIAQLLG